MTAEERLQNVEDQVVLAHRGQINVMSCPYCQKFVQLVDGTPFCCTRLCAAVNAVIDRMEVQEKMDAAARIADNAENERQEIPLVTLQ